MLKILRTNAIVPFHSGDVPPHKWILGCNLYYVFLNFYVFFNVNSFKLCYFTLSYGL